LTARRDRGTVRSTGGSSGAGRVAQGVVRGLTLVLFGITLGLTTAIVVIELAVRLAPGILPQGLRMLNRVYQAEANWNENWAGDEYLGYRPRPGSELKEDVEGRKFRQQFVRLDSMDLGVRDMGFPLENVDAIVIGDSFAFCDGVSTQECWVRLLSDETGRRFADLGVPGYSAIQETRLLARYGVPLRPRLILSAIFLNDFSENLRFTEWLEGGQGNYIEWVRSRRLGPWTDFLERKSVVYRLVRRTTAALERGIHRWHGKDGDIRFSAGGWWREMIDVDAQDRRWKLMRETVLEQKRLAASIDAQLVVLLLPFKEQAYWHIVEPFAVRRDHCDPDRPYRLVADLCRAEHIPVLDLTETFRTHARENEVLYFKDDAHWNVAGNALAARTVAAFLRDHGLVHLAGAVSETH
jgi:hypothetical protein